MSKGNKEQNKIKGIIKELEKSNSITIKNAMFFLPDDIKKFKGRGKWVLFINKGLLVRLEEKKKNKGY